MTGSSRPADRPRYRQGFGKPLIYLAAAFPLLINPVRVQAETSEWEFYIAPYAWGLGLDGDISHGPYHFKAEASFSDLWSDLNWGGMGAFQAQKGKFGILVDGLYVDFSDDVSLTNLPLPFPVDIDIDNKTSTGLLAATFRVLDTPGGFVDLVAGYRYWSIETDVYITVPIADLDVSEGADWHDGQLGIRGHANLSPRFYIEGMALTGIRSDRTVDLTAFAGYRINDCTAIMAGFRRISIDYSDSRYRFDATLHGPAIGFSYRF